MSAGSTFGKSASPSTPLAGAEPTINSKLDESDLDPAAFLKSVRELSEKREREDNERFRKLEEEVAKGRQERLARRAEYARSISPEKRVGTPNYPSQPRPSSRGTADTHTSSPTPSIRAATPTMAEQSTTRKTSGVEDIPEFTGFGSARKTSNTASPIARPPAMSPSASPTPAARSSPSAAMPSRSGTMKWQQRPQSRGGASRPLSMVAVENSTQGHVKAETSPERSREDIASMLGSRDPSWFRQTADRGIGNAAFVKSKDEVEDAASTSVGRQGLAGMISASSSGLSSRITSQDSTADQKTLPYAASSRSSTALDSVSSLAESRVASVMSDANRSSIGLVSARLNRGSSRSPSPTKEMGGFVQSAMLKRSDSINKRSSTQITTGTGRSGYGGLQGSHSMPRLERPADEIAATDSLVRTSSTMDVSSSGTIAAANGNAHIRQKSITSSYTTNDAAAPISAPASPSKRWSPNKSSWVESALTTKLDARPPSPAKNAPPAWMANLAKAKGERAQSPVHSEPAIRIVSDEAPPKTVSTMSVTGLGIDAGTPVKRVDSAPEATSTTAQVTTDIGSKLTAVKSAGDVLTKQKPQVSPKPQIDFRSTLKSRAPATSQPQQQPEFLSRFGSLRKTTTEKYVAPDMLKDNILRGKAGLAVTDGPQKTVRRDEFKESIQAKKEEWRREKQDGVVHEHKIKTPPVTPKPEALSQREVLGRTGTIKAPPSPEKEKAETPEALRRHQSIRSKPVATPQFAVKGAEKLASRMAPQLAHMLARGPPTDNKAQPARLDSDEKDVTRVEVEPSDASGPLQDVRKGRAKGPKRRKAETKADITDADDSEPAQQPETTTEVTPAMASSPKSASTASIMMASLGRAKPIEASPAQEQLAQTTEPELEIRDATSTSPSKDVPAFTGFGKKPEAGVQSKDENKENRSSDLSFLPSMRNAKSAFSERPTAKGMERPPQIQLPSRKDEEAAMRSAGLLAAASPTREPEPSGRSSGPLKPTKSSRTVSGQLQEASPNKAEIPVKPPDARATQALIDVFGNVPRAASERTSDVPEVANSRQASDVRRTLRREVHELDTQTSRLVRLNGTEEYTFYDSDVGLIQHVYMTSGRTQFTAIYTWRGKHASATNLQSAQQHAKTMARQCRPAVVLEVQQGRETEAFLQAIGGILISRCGHRGDERTDYLLCGRRHLRHVVFDELAIAPDSFSTAYVYLLYCTGRLFLWKGAACSTEELSAGRLVATDLARSGHFEEIREGTEPAALLSKLNVESGLPAAHPTLQRKAEMPDEFAVRLFRLHTEDYKQGLFSSLFARRPSWNSQASPMEESKLLSTEMAPFLQEDLEVTGLYMLDGFSQIYVLLGPLFPAMKQASFVQALCLCEEYVHACENSLRRIPPTAVVVLAGVPEEMRYFFRQWHDDHGLWGTAGLLSGTTQSMSMPLEDVLNVIRVSG